MSKFRCSDAKGGSATIENETAGRAAMYYARMRGEEGDYQHGDIVLVTVTGENGTSRQFRIGLNVPRVVYVASIEEVQ